MTDDNRVLLDAIHDRPGDTSGDTGDDADTGDTGDTGGTGPGIIGDDAGCNCSTGEREGKPLAWMLMLLGGLALRPSRRRR